MRTTTYEVSGMTCQHCVNAVTEELSKLPGVLGVRVELGTDGPSSVNVDSDADLEPAAVRDAIDEAGYELVAGRHG